MTRQELIYATVGGLRLHVCVESDGRRRLDLRIKRIQVLLRPLMSRLLHPIVSVKSISIFDSVKMC